MRIEEDVPNLQTMEMDTRTADGSVHTTKSIRVCFPGERIVYKQVVLPALMTAHTGRWSLLPTATGVRAVSQHSVMVKDSAIRAVLGEDATLASAKAFIRTALGGNSTATLKLAKAHAEARG